MSNDDSSILPSPGQVRGKLTNHNHHADITHAYAKESILWCRWAAAYYLQQRQRGAHHHTAVRALAYKWQRIIWKCWQTHTPYDDTRYEDTLRRRASQIVALFDQVQLGKSPWKNPVKNS